ncbi:hypothetical protein INR49_015162 [Caranx melampygus]|nr:hypothetical protein INR49_015162 [Caranx melampygus]
MGETGGPLLCLVPRITCVRLKIEMKDVTYNKLRRPSSSFSRLPPHPRQAPGRSVYLPLH